jgi:HSP20 family molecular chaperone IbpA
MSTHATEHGFCVYNDEWPLTLEGAEPELPEEGPESYHDVPAFEVRAREDDVVLIGAVPGLTNEDIDIQVGSDHVVIAAHHFWRTITLPVEIEVTKVTAQLKDGVLTVRAERKPVLKEIRVDVRAAEE